MGISVLVEPPGSWGLEKKDLIFFNAYLSSSSIVFLIICSNYLLPSKSKSVLPCLCEVDGMGSFALSSTPTKVWAGSLLQCIWRGRLIRPGIRRSSTLHALCLRWATWVRRYCTKMPGVCQVAYQYSCIHPEEPDSFFLIGTKVVVGGVSNSKFNLTKKNAV